MSQLTKIVLKLLGAGSLQAERPNRCRIKEATA